MLKVKKQIQRKIKSNNQDDYLKNQNDLKNSIKNLYIGNQNKKKTIDEYAELTTQIREQYAKLQNENNQLKNTLEKYKHIYILKKCTHRDNEIGFIRNQ